MPAPALVYYETEREYRDHYERVYCRGVITTFDGIRVYFHQQKFGHAFYESSSRDGRKDQFSSQRACRIDWIKATLEHPDAFICFGWNKDKKAIDKSRRVSVVYEEFVVIIGLKRGRDGGLKGEFVTAYLADNSIGKIRSQPEWSLEEFEG